MIGDLNTIVCENISDFSRAASEWCRERIETQNAKSVFLPAGNTPTPLYDFWENESPSFLNGVRFLQVDDVLTGAKQGMFKTFFLEHLPSYSRQFEFIAQASSVADVGVLGLGLNGHVAFHEPEMPSSFFSGCVKLNRITCENLDLEPGSWGITYGAAAFLSARSLLILVTGKSKREILKRVFDRDSKLPVVHLLGHADLTFILDREAATGVL